MLTNIWPVPGTNIEARCLVLVYAVLGSTQARYSMLQEREVPHCRRKRELVVKEKAAVKKGIHSQVNVKDEHCSTGCWGGSSCRATVMDFNRRDNMATSNRLRARVIIRVGVMVLGDFQGYCLLYTKRTS